MAELYIGPASEEVLSSILAAIAELQSHYHILLIRIVRYIRFNFAHSKWSIIVA